MRKGVQPAFDEVIHAPHRLRIAVMLAAVDTMEFQAIRDELGVADSVLSKQLKVLSDAGYVRLEKKAGAGRPRTWVSLTRQGAGALAGHLAELQRMARMASPDGVVSDVH